MSVRSLEIIPLQMLFVLIRAYTSLSENNFHLSGDDYLFMKAILDEIKEKYSKDE